MVEVIEIKCIPKGLSLMVELPVGQNVECCVS